MIRVVNIILIKKYKCSGSTALYNRNIKSKKNSFKFKKPTKSTAGTLDDEYQRTKKKELTIKSTERFISGYLNIQTEFFPKP